MADVINIEKQTPRFVGAKQIAELLGVSVVWLRKNAEVVPGFLRVSAGARLDMYRWDLNKVLAWQDEQERGRQQSA